jgi:hypothetical protein
MNDPYDAGQRLDPAGIHAAIIPDYTYGRPLCARHRVRNVSHLFYDRDDAIHVCRGCAMAHDYKHDALDLR